MLTPAVLRLALLAAAASLALSSSGDAFALAALLGLLAADVMTWGSAALVAVALLARWGSSSLKAIAGAQAVLGPAGQVGSARHVVAAWLMGLALASASPGGLPAIAFGAAAGLVVAGPAVGPGMDGLATRGLGALAGIAVAVACGRWVPPRLARWLSLTAAAAALLLVLPGSFG